MNDLTLNLYHQFAQLLEYPTDSLRNQVKAGADLLAAVKFPLANALAGFSEFVDKEPLKRVQEVYTATFDLQGSCCPYVGHHLFGESYQRSWFMAQLSGAYRELGFDPGNELPDHLAVVLRFLAQGHEGEFSLVLLNEGLIPAVDRMLQAFKGEKKHPYGQVLEVLQIVLQPGHEVEKTSVIGLEKGGVAND